MPKPKSVPAGPPEPPDHLGDQGAELWRAVVSEYALAEAQYVTLTIAAEALDRYEGARVLIAAEGLTVTAPSGAVKAHPAVAIERDARLSYLRAVRELALEPGAQTARPPRIA